MHFRIFGKRDKIRYVPVHAAAQRLIEEYLGMAGHGPDVGGPLFRPVRNNRTPEKLNRPLDPASVYRNIVRHYGLLVGVSGDVSGSASIRSALPRPPMPCRTRRILLRSRNGSAMPMFPLRGYMTGARRGPKIARPSRFSIRTGHRQIADEAQRVQQGLPPTGLRRSAGLRSVYRTSFMMHTGL